MRKHCQHNKDERTKFFKKKYTSHFIWKGYERATKDYVREVNWRLNKDCNILTPTLLVIAAFLSRSLGLLNRGPEGPASAGSESHSSNWNTDFKLWSPANSTSLSRRVISLFNVHLLPVASQFALNSTCWQSRLSTDIFDWMHLLFTQVHFPFDSSAGSEVNMLHAPV